MMVSKFGWTHRFVQEGRLFKELILVICLTNRVMQHGRAGFEFGQMFDHGLKSVNSA